MNTDKILMQKETGKLSHHESTKPNAAVTGVTRVVCTYQESKNYGFAVPDKKRFSKDIFIAKGHSMDARDGQKVVVEITNYGDADGHGDEQHGAGGQGNSGMYRSRGVHRNPEGHVIEVLGYADDPGTDILSIVRSLDLPEEFPVRVLNRAQRVAKPVSEADMAGRMDLRGVQMVTIDGEDAKDLDDAVSLDMDGENYVLGVHIADVANYVQENSALDKEAFERGTSVYLADRVIPMLPRVLSNGICSLNQGETRLAMSCIMTINPRGEVIDHVITESVICVNRRMSYTQVQKILEGLDFDANDSDISDVNPEAVAPEAYGDELTSMIRRMGNLAALLRRKRMSRGSIDFDLPETKVVLDSDGHAVDIKPYVRSAATDLIEDFMLIANETVAQEYYWRQIPFVYRTHENPDPERIRALAAFVANFGYTIHIGGDEFHPMEIQKLIAKLEGSDEEALISRLCLRSMRQAQYGTECIGHFGLASQYYCHFTSPIRRYPDLQIHRIIKDCLRGRMSDARITHYEEILPKVAAQSSQRERRAKEAERETVKLKKAEYMEQFVGEEFDGVISGVTEWGFFVELPNTVEGLVRLADLDDYYEFNRDAYELIGRRKGKRYKLGGRIKVIVTAADKEMRTVDFIPAPQSGEHK